MLAAWKKNYDKLDNLFKIRAVTLLTKICRVKAMTFPVVMYECESWIDKKAELWRIDAFKLWCWRRLLRVYWTARRSNQSILGKSTLNIYCKDWCWSWNANILATWCEEPTHWKRPQCWERLRARGEGEDRGWDGSMASLIQWTWVEQTLGDSEGQRNLVCCNPLGGKDLDLTEKLNKRTLTSSSCRLYKDLQRQTVTS